MRAVIDNAYLAARVVAKAFNRIHSQRLHNIDVGENTKKYFAAEEAETSSDHLFYNNNLQNHHYHEYDLEVFHHPVQVHAAHSRWH